MRIRVNGNFVNINDEEFAKLKNDDLQDVFNKNDSVKQLAEGLSTATTIAQIRAVAKSILDETEGDAV